MLEARSPFRSPSQQCSPIPAEAAGFPLAAQAARLRREVAGQPPETVALLSSLPPGRLDAGAWLALNRSHWGIENGLHARLDISRRDDQCRLRASNAIFARLANSLFMHWRSHQPKPHHKTTTDFAASMSATTPAASCAPSPPATPTSPPLREYAVFQSFMPLTVLDGTCLHRQLAARRVGAAPHSAVAELGAQTMKTITKSTIGAGVTAAAAVGTAQGVAVYTAAVAAANTAGVYGAAATTAALASLGGGSVAAGGGGMVAGITAIASAAALPAAIAGATVAAVVYGGFRLWRWKFASSPSTEQLGIPEPSVASPVKCSRCGTPILPAAFRLNDGMCFQCNPRKPT